MTTHPTRDHAICEIAYAREAIGHLRTDLLTSVSDAASRQDGDCLRHLAHWAELGIDTLDLIGAELLRVGLRSPLDRDGGPTT